jgi:hypothetical protein
MISYQAGAKKSQQKHPEEAHLQHSRMMRASQKSVNHVR